MGENPSVKVFALHKANPGLILDTADGPPSTTRRDP